MPGPPPTRCRASLAPRPALVRGPCGRQQRIRGAGAGGLVCRLGSPSRGCRPDADSDGDPAVGTGLPRGDRRQRCHGCTGRGRRSRRPACRAHPSACGGAWWGRRRRQYRVGGRRAVGQAGGFGRYPVGSPIPAGLRRGGRHRRHTPPRAVPAVCAGAGPACFRAGCAAAGSEPGLAHGCVLAASAAAPLANHHRRRSGGASLLCRRTAGRHPKRRRRGEGSRADRAGGRGRAPPRPSSAHDGAWTPGGAPAAHAAPSL
mmetsp:Transcript_25417/g.82166  ORF Transcript_25417/g.82166 Transcript_25417/m.82166 type:complete len:259 (+) Transcript_25417:3762-4538(+)